MSCRVGLIPWGLPRFKTLLQLHMGSYGYPVIREGPGRPRFKAGNRRDERVIRLKFSLCWMPVQLPPDSPLFIERRFLLSKGRTHKLGCRLVFIWCPVHVRDRKLLPLDPASSRLKPFAGDGLRQHWRRCAPSLQTSGQSACERPLRMERVPWCDGVVCD